ERERERGRERGREGVGRRERGRERRRERGRGRGREKEREGEREKERKGREKGRERGRERGREKEKEGGTGSREKGRERGRERRRERGREREREREEREREREREKERGEKEGEGGSGRERERERERRREREISPACFYGGGPSNFWQPNRYKYLQPLKSCLVSQRVHNGEMWFEEPSFYPRRHQRRLSNPNALINQRFDQRLLSRHACLFLQHPGSEERKAPLGGKELELQQRQGAPKWQPGRSEAEVGFSRFGPVLQNR
ncbi:Zinc finger CCCH domain-containing protein 13, partial [Ophiophagus hannah]